MFQGKVEMCLSEGQAMRSSPLGSPIWRFACRHGHASSEFCCNAPEEGKKSCSKGRQSGACRMNFMKRITGAVALGAALLVGAGLSALPAWAGDVVTLTEQDGNVVANGSGPIDVTRLN